MRYAALSANLIDERNLYIVLGLHWGSQIEIMFSHWIVCSAKWVISTELDNAITEYFQFLLTQDGSSSGYQISQLRRCLFRILSFRISGFAFCILHLAVELRVSTADGAPQQNHRRTPARKRGREERRIENGSTPSPQYPQRQWA